jgi:hypothetical protein
MTVPPPDMRTPTSAKVGAAIDISREATEVYRAQPFRSTTYSLTQAQINRLLACGVTIASMICPTAIMSANGHRAGDGRFDPDPSGPAWFVFPEPEDNVYWNIETDEVATDRARLFALGEAIIGEASTYAFDCTLNIFEDPLAWLRAKRDGVVVLDWTIAFDRLRDCPRIAVSESLLSTYLRFVQPDLPASFVIMPGSFS